MFLKAARHYKLLALLLLPLPFFWQETLGRTTLASGDVAMFLYPMVKLAAEQLRAGQFPWWNPDPFGGMPLFTNLQAGLLDPFTWPLLLSPTSGMLTLSQLLTFLLALLAAYACARSMGLLRQASAVTAVIYAFNGFVVGRSLYPSTPRSYALAPLVICLIERLWRGGGRREIILASGVIAWQFFAGHPQILVYSAVLAGAYALFCAFLRRPQDVLAPSLSEIQGVAPHWRARAVFLCRCLLMYALGGLLSAIQLLPALELSRYSIRPYYRFEEFALNSLHPVTWLTVLFPFFHGGSWGAGPYKLGFWGAYWHHNETVLYLGPLALALALAGAIAVTRARNRAGVFWLVASGSALLLASGAYLGEAARWYQRSTILGSFRCTNRWWIVIALATALLAGLSVDRLLRKAERTTMQCHIRTASLAILIVCSLISGSLLLWPRQAEQVIRSLTGWGNLPAGFLGNWPAEFYLPLLTTGAVYALLRLLTRVAAQRWSWLLLLALLCDYQTYALASPIRSGTGFEPLVGTGLSAALAARQSVTDPLRYHLYSEPGPFAFDPFWFTGHEMTVGRDPLSLWRYRELTGIDEAGFSHRPDLLEAQNHVLDLLNVRYLVVRKDLAEELLARSSHQPVRASEQQDDQTKRFIPGTHLHGLSDVQRWQQRAELAGTTELHVFENQQALPRAWLVNKVAVCADQRQLQLIRGETRDEALGEFDPSQVALMTPENHRRLQLAWPVAQTAFKAGSVRITARQSHRMTLQTQHTQTSLLVLGEVWFPGWRVSVDGQAAELLQVDYLLRGVELPAGEHIVEFRFLPTSLLCGALLSALTGMALLGWWYKGKTPKLQIGA